MFGRMGNLFGQVVSSALTTTVDDAARLATEEGRDWNCPLSRPQIMEVWAAARPQVRLLCPRELFASRHLGAAAL